MPSSPLFEWEIFTPFLFSCGEASRSMDDNQAPPLILEILADRGKRDMLAYGIEVSELNSEVTFELRGPRRLFEAVLS